MKEAEITEQFRLFQQEILLAGEAVETLKREQRATIMRDTRVNSDGKRKGHHACIATPRTVRGEPGGVRIPEAPRRVSPLGPRVPRVPPRDRRALAILCPLRDTAGHALPWLQ